MQSQRLPNAFISCSLREEDKPFVQYITAITRQFGFQPMGTVGMFSGAPRPIWEQMRDNVAASDCVILVATPRYIQQDIHDRERTGKGISEMLHVEVGMAVAAGRPILAFALESTDLGAFLPQAVQYIPLRLHDRQELQSKWPLISNYFRSAMAMIEARWIQEQRNDMLKGVGTILGFIGAAKVADWLFRSE
jgi:hypothetical protein